MAMPHVDFIQSFLVYCYSGGAVMFPAVLHLVAPCERLVLVQILQDAQDTVPVQVSLHLVFPLDGNCDGCACSVMMGIINLTQSTCDHHRHGPQERKDFIICFKKIGR